MNAVEIIELLRASANEALLEAARQNGKAEAYGSAADLVTENLEGLR